MSVFHKDGQKVRTPEKAVFTNMVMIEDDKGNVLVQNRTKGWNGLVFPGGHLESKEMAVDSAIRDLPNYEIIEKELKEYEYLDSFFQKIKDKYGIDDLDYLEHICRNHERLVKKERALEIIKKYVGVELIDIINAIREGIYFNDTTRCGTKEVYGEISSIQWFNDKWCFYVSRFATYIPIKEKDTCWWLTKKNMNY